jgi:hypothetical protein
MLTRGMTHTHVSNIRLKQASLLAGIWGWFLLPVFLFNWITVVPYSM